MPREAGYIITTPHDGSRETVVGTFQCCHCQRHWTPQPGSGKKRGFCLKCMKVTCGREKCDACVPAEQWLENAEKGRPADHRNVVVPSGWVASPGGILAPRE